MFYDNDLKEFYLYDDIGPGHAQELHAAVRESGGGTFTVRVNSYGGSVDEALAMVEILKRHELAGNKVLVTVDAIAASAASLFAAEFASTAAEHSRVMIHNPWGVAMGDANQMRQTADVLDRYKESIVSIYSRAMSIGNEEVSALLDAETWYNAGGAAAAGLVGEVTLAGEEPLVAARLVSAKRFKNTPEDLLDVEIKNDYLTEPGAIESEAGTVKETPALAAARNQRIKSLFAMRAAGYEN
jgi:ATP-dependent protease ClpP protease subunit